MADEHLKKDNYELCYENLFEKFKTMDFDLAAKASGNTYDSRENKIYIKFLEKDYTLNCQTGEILPDAQRDSLVILTHLMRYETYKDTELTGRLISLKEAPGGGLLFYPAFKEMAIDPLANTFGNNARAIYEAADVLGGVRAALGDASITINVFPKIPVTLVVWEGDEEFPPSATILYDKSVSDYVHIEDVIVVGIAAAEKVIAICGKQ